jgi:hypothetical protein
LQGFVHAHAFAFIANQEGSQTRIDPKVERWTHIRSISSM